MLRNLPPKKDRQASKTAANKLEAKHAKKLGAKKHIASGAVGRSGDCSTKQFLFDSKSTRGESLRVTKAEVARVCTQARQQNKSPALILELSTSVVTTPKTWVAIPLDVFMEIAGEI